jgi:hypothetical protein
VTEPIVGLALDRIAENIVGRLDRGELGLRAVVVIQVGVIDPDLFAVRVLDLVLGGIGGDLEKVVKMICHVSVEMVSSVSGIVGEGL